MEAMMRARRARRRGTTLAETLLVVATVAMAGTVALGTWGAAADGAIARSAAAHGGPRALVVSRQAGAAEAARYAESFGTSILARVPHPGAAVRDAVWSKAEVSTLRDAAHAHWRTSPGDGVLGTARVGGRDVPVAAVPRFSRITPVEADPTFGLSHYFADAHGLLAHQERRLLDLLDGAMDLAFARGQTGQSEGGRYVRLTDGDAMMLSHVNQRYLPANMWEVHMHGSDGVFKERLPGGGVGVVEPEALADAMGHAGHTAGQPVLVRTCNAGQCMPTPHNAAQRLSDALDSPTIAPSNLVATYSGSRPFVTGQWDDVLYTVGEWRLFTPRAWGGLPVTDHAVIGRAAGNGETLLGSVADLWRLPEGGAQVITIQGHWNQVLGINDGALVAAHRALAERGQLTLRFMKQTPESRLRTATEAAGFRTLSWEKSDALDAVLEKIPAPRP